MLPWTTPGFDPAGLGDVVVVAGLELLRDDQPPSEKGPAVRETDGTLEATWPVAGRGLEIQAPTRAVEL